MARALWSGVIGFGLVSIPVKLFSATESKGIKFHQIHSKCQTQIKEQRYCPTCDRKVEWSEIEKGFEYEKGKFINLSEEDMAKLPLPSKNLISVSAFVNLDEIDPIYFEKSYFIQPDKNGEHSFALLSKALQDKGMVGIASIALRTRERLCAIRPFGNTLIINTLYYPDELRASEEHDVKDVKIPAQELKLATHLIDMLATKFNPDEYTDHYREALQELIDAKISGLPISGQPAKASGGKVVDLMASLKASLEKAKSVKGPQAVAAKSTAKAAAKKIKAPVKSRTQEKATAKKRTRGAA